MWKQLFPDNLETLCQVLWDCSGKHIKIIHPRALNKLPLKKKREALFSVLFLVLKRRKPAAGPHSNAVPITGALGCRARASSHSPRSMDVGFCKALGTREGKIHLGTSLPCLGQHVPVVSDWWRCKYRPGHGVVGRDLWYRPGKCQILHLVLWGRPAYISRAVCNHGINIDRTDDTILAVWSNSLPSFQ